MFIFRPLCLHTFVLENYGGAAVFFPYSFHHLDRFIVDTQKGPPNSRHWELFNGVGCILHCQGDVKNAKRKVSFKKAVWADRVQWKKTHTRNSGVKKQVNVYKAREKGRKQAEMHREHIKMIKTTSIESCLPSSQVTRTICHTYKVKCTIKGSLVWA